MNFELDTRRECNLAYKIALEMGVPQNVMSKQDRTISVKSEPMVYEFEQEGKKRRISLTTSKQVKHAIDFVHGEDDCGSSHEDIKRALGM